MRKILLLFLLLPLIGIGQSRKKQIIKLNHQLDSLYNINYSLNSVIKTQETTYLNVISNKKKEIESLNNHILSLNKENNHLNLEISSLKNKIETLNKQLNSPYRLSKGIIDHRLFTFINSDNFYENGIEDLQKMIQINNINIDSITVEDLNEFPGCGACCDMEEFWNEDILYFKEGKVLIVEKHYNGDWESSSADWYDCYLYNTDKKRFENKLTLRSSDRFAYNYNTNFVVFELEEICDNGDPYYQILNNKLENIGLFFWYDLTDNISNFYWNEIRNVIIFTGDERSSEIYKNINGEWEIKKI